MKINVVRKQGNQVSCAFLEFLHTHEKLPSLSYYFKNNRNSLCECNVCSVNNNDLSKKFIPVLYHQYRTSLRITAMYRIKHSPKPTITFKQLFLESTDSFLP